MNWNKNNNDNNPWGSGGNNNPWGSGGSGDGPNRRDFEDSIRKAKDRFGNFKFGGRRNLSIFIICLLYTSPSPRDRTRSRMPSSA